ncbi:MAG: hypothetical protein IJF67_11485 [Clostridia bacterium]|nr:hypothetical protein [Clostridia bacterium]
MKKHTSLILLAAILLQLTACGGSENSNDTHAPDTTSAGTAESAPSEYTKPDVTYNGKTVTITGYDYTGNYVIRKYHIALDEENGDIINDAIVKRNRAVEEALNVNIELVSLTSNDRNNAAVLEKYIMAQEDVITFGTQMSAGLSNLLTTDGMLVDLNDISTLDLTHTWWNQNANEEYTIEGKQFAAIGDVNLFNLGAPVVLFFSKTMVDESKLENPYQLVYDGKWTLDAMSKMVADASHDVNGNSENDEEDNFGLACEGDSIFYMMYSAGARYSKRDSKGNIHASLNTEQSIDLTETIIPMMRNKTTTLYNGDWSSKYTTSVFTELFVPKLMANELLFLSNQLYIALDLRAMETDFGIIPMPKYDEAQENYLSIANTWWSDHIVVPATNTELEMTGHLLDAMGYYSQQYITPAFIDQSVIGKGVRDEDSVEMINLILENQIFDIGLIFNWGGMTGMLQKMASSGTPSFASSWAGIEPAVLAAMEKTVSMLKGE